MGARWSSVGEAGGTILLLPASSLRSAMRARAVGLARRVAIGALERLGREVDRLAVALEPVRGAIPLRETGAGRVEIEVGRWGMDRTDRGAGPVTGMAEPPTIAGNGSAEDATITDTTAGNTVPVVMPPPPPTSPPPASVPSPPPAPVPAPPLARGMAQAAHLRARMEPRLAALRDGAAWEHAEDPAQTLRRLRVATRRLRAFTSLFAPIIGDKRATKLKRRLREITRGAGPRREWDALLEGLRAEHANAEPMAQAALEHVIARGEERRDEATRRARKALSGIDMAALADALDDELDRVCGRMLRLDDELPAHARAWLEPELRRMFAGMPDPKSEEEIEGWHEVRKRAKSVRYAVALLRPTLEEVHAELGRPARGVQRALGAHHDCSVLLEALREHKILLETHRLPTLAGALATVELTLRRKRAAAYEAARQVIASFCAAGPSVLA